MINPSTIRQVCNNGSVASPYWGERITIAQVVDLLVNAAGPARHAAVKMNARALLEKMEDRPWVLGAGAHRGGTGGKDREADQTQHITLSVANATYHLRLDKSGHIFEITGPGLKIYYPWASPGTDVGGFYRGQGRA